MSDPFLTDLKLTRRLFDAQVSDREVVDLIVSASGDLQTVSGNANLAQAIVNRLLTRRGELGVLGHPAYGSRLYMLIGELNNARTRGLAEIYIRECLAQEPRVKEIVKIVFSPISAAADRDVMIVTVMVKPAGDGNPLSFTIPIRLGG